MFRAFIKHKIMNVYRDYYMSLLLLLLLLFIMNMNGELQATTELRVAAN